MSLPELSGSLLQTKAAELRINPNQARLSQRLRLYRETVRDIRELFYQQKTLRKFSRLFIEVLEEDLGTMIQGLKEAADKGNKDYLIAKSYLEIARVELGVAIELYEDQEEADATTRIRNRLTALEKCKAQIDKAFLSWPG